jgi:hypothetical protein
MLAPFGNFYHTLGPWLTILAAGATVYAVAGRRGPETLGVLYFSFVYYLLINLTGAAGFIRHAQPSYIAPVFYTLLLADTAYAAAGRKAALLGAAALTGIFAWYAAFDPAPFQRRTIANYTDHIFPYEQAVDYIRALGGRQKIYAPMEVEPSHFYLAKAGLAGKIDWDRTLPPDLSAEKAAGACAAMACDYILLPYSSFVGVDTDFTRIADGLTAAGAFRTEKVFDYHGNRLILLKKNVRNTR